MFSYYVTIPSYASVSIVPFTFAPLHLVLLSIAIPSSSPIAIVFLPLMILCSQSQITFLTFNLSLSWLYMYYSIAMEAKELRLYNKFTPPIPTYSMLCKANTCKVIAEYKNLRRTFSWSQARLENIVKRRVLETAHFRNTVGFEGNLQTFTMIPQIPIEFNSHRCLNSIALLTTLMLSFSRYGSSY